MENSEYSTVSFKSNIQPVKSKYILNDYKFLSFIRDPFALELLQKAIANLSTGFKMSSIQEEEYKKASLHCFHAFKDDYPNGTILADGEERVVCKCLNASCENFSKCRPDFYPEELNILEENKSIEKRIKSIPKPVEEKTNITERDAKIFHHNIDNEKTDSYAESIVSVSKQPAKKFLPDLEQPEQNEYTVKKVFSKKTFASFQSVYQEDYITANYKQRTIINAGPGTGKTWSLIEKLIQMVDCEGVEPDAILVLCFSRAAVEVIENRLREAASKGKIGLEWRQIEIRTFDSFATYMISWVQENHSELLPDGYDLNNQDYEDRIRTATRILLEKKDMFDQYQHLIVDEVQDLVGFRAEFVLEILGLLPEECGFSLLGDACQAIYDYQPQNDKSVMSSIEFYQKIFDVFRDVNYLEFCENHRQQADFALLTLPYRKAILDGQTTERKLAAKAIRNAISTLDNLNIKHPQRSEIEKIRDGGTLGILTRTNGQALKISTWLKNEGIDHTLQRPNSSTNLAGWIAKVFMQYEYETINEDSFVETFTRTYPEEAVIATQYWTSLLSAQKEYKSRYRTSELLHGVMENSRDKTLFSFCNLEADIVVSNIHRAKGREFDTVLILDDILAALEDKNSEDLLEHKVCYVALTRPKKHIEKLNLSEYIRQYKNSINRCYQTGMRKKPYLSHIEIGLTGDLNPISFAANANLQETICNNLKIGTRLRMQKSKNATKEGYYDLLAEEGTNIILGTTSRTFKRDFSGIVHSIYGLPETAELYEYMFPNAFSDIYVDDLITYISNTTADKPGAKIFDDICIWSGFSVVGFAQRENDRY